LADSEALEGGGVEGKSEFSDGSYFGCDFFKKSPSEEFNESMYEST